MGLYDHLEIEPDVDLPAFEGDHQDVDWQTKTVGRPYMQTYKLTADGRLLRQEQSMRDRTPEERTEQARERGYDSWEEWEAADTFGPLPSWEQTVDEEWWVDHHQHGTFEFHGATDKHRYSYEARFTKGALEGIVLLSKEPREGTGSPRSTG